MRIILASASPRRRELLEQIGLQFEVRVSDADENVAAAGPADLVEKLSRRKAEAVLSGLEPGEEAVLVIGADTVVALGDRILGKPKDSRDAAEMLGELSGREHSVYTGVTLLYRPGREKGASGGKAEEGRACPVRTECRTFHERTEVHFFPLSREEILFYVSTGDPLDKAGAYGIQGLFARYVERIDGDYNNVVGLPAGRLYQEAKEWLEEAGCAAVRRNEGGEAS